MQIPEYLYHYTTIESLALILSNRTIRLNNLENMDDLDEGVNKENIELQRNVYVSSWTADESESIPLWNLYTYNMQGVRIKLPSMFFEEVNTEDLRGDNTIIKTIPFTYGEENGELIYDRNVLCRVNYTDNQDQLCPETSMRIDDNIYFQYLNIGTSKKSCWSFQDEWRYKVYSLEETSRLRIAHTEERLAFTIGFFSDEKFLQDLATKENHKIYGKTREKVKYVDLKIAEDKFNDMEITLGPQVNAGQELIVKVLLEKYNPAAQGRLNRSRLNIR